MKTFVHESSSTHLAANSS